MKTAFFRSATLIAAAILTIGAGKPSAPANWLAQISETPSGSHVIGNPAAKLRLVEYVSYTCSHCADFEKEGTGELALGMIRPGKGSMEYRPFMRNLMDVAATLLVGCGEPARFPGNHAAVLRTQANWLTPVTVEQYRRWTAMPDFAARMRSIANDMKLYPIFEARGYSRVDLDRCLANEALAKTISEENKRASTLGSVKSTPSFLINDRLQDAGNWAALRPLIMAATR